ncbi:MAG TPA: hypothetical protein VFQ39_16355, partial [Longimicrobium sp.]|nr:hypothetical protein [Longimicrobium sp.]
SHDDERLRRGWAAFRGQAAALCPFHGAPLIGRADLPRLLRALAEPLSAVAAREPEPSIDTVGCP